MDNPLNLTENEKTAKDFFIKIFSAYETPIDTGRIDDLRQTFPIWFDETKYQRGRKFYENNKASIMQSHIHGMICTFADPPTLDIVLEFLPSSSEAYTKMLIETILHVISWYDYELTTDSRSWKSLNRVRRLHLVSSNVVSKKGIGIISQTEVSMTLFTFVGFTIVRSHHYGIPNNNKEDLESFVHFWGIMGHFLGLKDEYNICLCDFEVFKIICEIFIRYVYIPILQFEPPDFKELITYTVDGLHKFVPDLRYDSLMFMVKRVCNIPGYQYGVDIGKENIIKDMFTRDEIKQLQQYVSRSKYFAENSIRIFPEKIHIVEIVKDIDKFTDPNYDEQELKFEQYIKKNYKILGLKKFESFIIKTIPQEDCQLNFCDTKMRDCSRYGRFLVRFKCFIFWFNSLNFGRYINNIIMDKVLDILHKWCNKKKLL